MKPITPRNATDTEYLTDSFSAQKEWEALIFEIKYAFLN